jgi:SAM-dependent methyltransferase
MFPARPDAGRRTELPWLTEAETLDVARTLMERNRVQVVAIRAADGKPVGLLRKRDLAGKSPQEAAGDVCGPWVAVEQDDLLEDAMALLEAERLGRAPVVAGGEVVGTISRGGIRTYRDVEREFGLNLVELVRDVSPNDTMFRMYEGRMAVYLSGGPAALRSIRRSFKSAGRTDPPESILDFGCGFGRVLRFLKLAFPEARLTASDIDAEAVEFCRRVFGATPIQSGEDPGEIALRDSFDLIWCFSVLTHVNSDRWPGFLRFFESHLSPGGVLVFTTGGSDVAEGLREGAFDYTLQPDAISTLLDQFDRDGFGYVDYPDWPNYGVAISTADWVRQQIEATTSLRVVDIHERGGDDHQDVVTCVAGEGRAAQ